MEDNFYENFSRAWFDMAKRFFPLGLDPKEILKGNYPINFNSFRDFDKFLEKALWFPPFAMFQGNARPVMELHKDYWELASVYMNLYKEWMDVYTEVSRAWAEGTTNAFRKLMAEPTGASENYQKEAYSTWIQELEGRLDTLLKDPNFSSKLTGLLSKLVDVKKKCDSITERQYSMMSIPTRSELDKIYKEMYEMKKKLRDVYRTMNVRTEESKR